jgi:predicted ATP-dependent serine protease
LSGFLICRNYKGYKSSDEGGCMAKNKNVFVCQECAYEAPKWLGKSTLLLQTAKNICDKYGKVLYVSGEE